MATAQHEIPTQIDTLPDIQPIFSTYTELPTLAEMLKNLDFLEQLFSDTVITAGGISSASSEKQT